MPGESGGMRSAGKLAGGFDVEIKILDGIPYMPVSTPTAVDRRRMRRVFPGLASVEAEGWP